MGIYIPIGGGSAAASEVGVVLGQGYLVDDPNGTVGDQTAGLQAAINATPRQGLLKLPPYRFTINQVTFPNPLRMTGFRYNNVAGGQFGPARFNPTHGFSQYGTVIFSTYQGNSDTCTSTASPPGGPTTVTTTNPHSLVTGQALEIAGMTGSPLLNNMWTITVTGPTTFTVPLNTNLTGPGSGGTAIWGAALDCTQTGQGALNGGWSFENFALIGPGQGTSTGLLTPPPISGAELVDATVNNVRLINWYTGANFYAWEECSSRDVHVSGCRRALWIAGACNNNQFINLDINTCGALTGYGPSGSPSNVTTSCIDCTGSGNLFLGGAFQSDDNQGFNMLPGASNNVIKGWWDEANAVNSYPGGQFIYYAQVAGNNVIDAMPAHNFSAINVNGGALTIRDTQLTSGSTNPHGFLFTVNLANPSNLYMDNSVVQNLVNNNNNPNAVTWAGGGTRSPRPNEDYGAWAFDYTTPTTTLTMAQATMYGARISLDWPMTIANVLFYVVAAGSGLSNSFVSIYGSNNTLLWQSADLSATNYATTGLQTVPIPLASQLVLAGGSNLDLVFVVFYVGSMTAGAMPQIWQAQGLPAGVSFSPTTNRLRFWQHGLPNTATMPNSLPSNVAGPPVWAAVR